MRQNPSRLWILMLRWQALLPASNRRFYMRTLQVLDEVPKAMKPADERHGMRRQVVEMSAKRRRMNIPQLSWETGTMKLVFSKRSVLGERDWSCSEL